MAFDKVGRNQQGGAVELIDEDVVTAREGLRQNADSFREIGGLLVDLKVPEHEGDARGPKRSRRAVEQQTAVERIAFSTDLLFFCSTAPLFRLDGEKAERGGFEPPRDLHPY